MLAASLLVSAALGAAPSVARAQDPASGPRLEIGRAGPGRPGELLRSALARPHVVIAPSSPTIVLPPDSLVRHGVVVVGADVVLEGEVRGDVVVIGGDLFFRPGAVVQGRAITYGGGIYFSLLARLGGAAHAFRDVGYRPVERDGVLVLDHQRLRAEEAGAFALPGIYGLRLPTYTRVDGAAVSVGPSVTLAAGTLEIDPTVTYRSHLGVLDPAVRVTFEPERPLRLELRAARGTVTNDAWIRGDLVNSAATLAFGDDARNYHRATRVEAMASTDLARGGAVLTPGLGARTERASSLGPNSGTTSAPWSAWGRRDRERMLRPNPAVTGGWITSALGSLEAGWATDAIDATALALIEVPVAVSTSGRYVQATLDASVGVRTVGTHRLTARVHLVATAAADSAPGQRHAYLGGGPTLATVDPLALGGDQLLFVEGVYLVPLPGPTLPLLGAPAVGVRYAGGTAGVGRLPAFTHNVGARVQIGPAQVDLMVDPATGDRAIGVSVAATR